MYFEYVTWDPCRHVCRSNNKMRVDGKLLKVREFGGEVGATVDRFVVGATVGEVSATVGACVAQHS